MSLASRVTLKVLKLVRAKEQVRLSFIHRLRGSGTLDPGKFKPSLQPRGWEVDGFRMVTLLGGDPSRKHVIFLHGGAYVLEATPPHRRLAEKLAGNYGLAVTLIDYPKSPEHTFRATHAVVQAAYRQLRERYPGHDFRLLGDSAGGGLALAFLQSLRDQGITPLPGRTALLSPWLDLTMSNPQVPDYESRDPILSLRGLAYAARLYAGGEDPRQPLLSPLFGEFHDLGLIKLVFGSEEVFYPDCRALIDKIQDAPGTEVDWVVGEDLIHDWPIFPFGESRAMLDNIARFLLAE